MQSAGKSNQFQEVTVLFRDESISELFSALLSAMGARPTVVNGDRIDSLDLACLFEDGGLLVTEGNVFYQVDPEFLERSLFVTNPGVQLPSGAKTLPRPLSEETLEAALDQLLTQ